MSFHNSDNHLITFGPKDLNAIDRIYFAALIRVCCLGYTHLLTMLAFIASSNLP